MEYLSFILNFIKINIELNFTLMLLFFFIFLTIYNAISLPGNLVFFISTGYFFGLYIGFLISIFSLVIGSLFFIIFSSFVIKKIFPKLHKKYSNKINTIISASSLEYLIIFRMIPGPPLMLQNFCLSILNIKKSIFLLSSFIGFTPIVFISVYSGFQISNFEKIKNFSISNIFSTEFLLFLFFFIFFLVIRIIYKKK